MPAAAITLALGFVLGLGVLFAWRRSRAASGEAVAPKVLAVLPFENLGDPTDAYFADGVADEVRTKLSQLPGMEVIARGSSNQYRNTTKSPQQIARELGADYLLTATVRWSKGPRGASRVRVAPELVDAGVGHAPHTRWGQQFEASLTDVFKVQAQIAGEVAQALDVALDDSSREQLVARPTRNFDAYDAFLRGEQLIITEGKTDVVSAAGLEPRTPTRCNATPASPSPGLDSAGRRCSDTTRAIRRSRWCGTRTRPPIARSRWRRIGQSRTTWWD